MKSESNHYSKGPVMPRVLFLHRLTEDDDLGIF